MLRLSYNGQEYIATTWAMANMNMVIHDMEGTIEIGDTMNSPKFRELRKSGLSRKEETNCKDLI